VPTAYPARGAWLHVVVRDGNGGVAFESGALNRDGSIVGNDNDADASKFEPHYAEITAADQVQIYEAILVDSNGRVTTGLLTATHYLKDNRLLPRGFEKQTAQADIAVHGSHRRCELYGSRRPRCLRRPFGGASGPFTVDAELLYQPIGFRWPNNLKRYAAAEPRRFTSYYDSMSTASATTSRRR
jgi:hypothetical protein